VRTKKRVFFPQIHEKIAGWRNFFAFTPLQTGKIVVYYTPPVYRRHPAARTAEHAPMGIRRFPALRCAEIFEEVKVL
jgi:hypothetical protein